jgi:NAD-dependent DNA ligase
MSESLSLKQPKRTETSVVATCSKCKSEVYKEVIVECQGVPVERLIYGTSKQALDVNGNPVGPIVPFCNCENDNASCR